MSRRRGALSLRLALVLTPTLLVGAVAGIGALRPAGSFESEARVGRGRLEAEFASLLRQAEGLAARALAAEPAHVLRAPLPLPLRGRLEGVGRLDAERRWVEWAGTPAEPPPAGSDWPPWLVRVDGVRTRLLARAGPAADGAYGVASLVIDSTLDDGLAFSGMLPRTLVRDVAIEIELTDTEALAGQSRYVAPAPAAEESAPDGVVRFELRAPSGESLALASIAPRSAELSTRHSRQRGLAAAAATFVLLAVLVFGRRPHGAPARESVAWVAAIVLARAILLLTEAPALLLPRSLGSPSLYGSTQLAGLLASPADAVLTAAAALASAWVLSAHARAIARRRPALGAALALGLALASTAGAAALTLSIARDSRMIVADGPGVADLDARLAVWLALALALLGAATLWGALVASLLRRERAARFSACALVLLTAAGSERLQRESERLALDQLEAEHVPQLLAQSSQRRLALDAALREVADRLVRGPEAGVPASSSPDFQAYYHWVHSELFHLAYRSSLDLYTPEGDRLSHFGFGVPELDESVQFGSASPSVHEETFDPALSVRERLLHAEISLSNGEQPLGVVVAHVLDEPDNLPFLPSSRPYLQALGPTPGDDGAGSRFVPEYVLFDATGSVLLTTLPEPPADSPALRQAALTGATVRLATADGPWAGIARAGEADRLHLLLLRGPGPIRRLAAAVRLAALCLLLLAGALCLTHFGRPGGLAALAAGLRSSFDRKVLASMLAASIVPLVGLAFVLQQYITGRAEAALDASAIRHVGSAQRVLEDYRAAGRADAAEARAGFSDFLLYWLQHVVGQEIHVYEDGLLRASSKRELFASGLLPRRLDGEVERQLVRGGLPYLVTRGTLGTRSLPVAYAPLRPADDEAGSLVVAVPLLLEGERYADAVSRVADVILLATASLVVLLALVARALARTVSRPVRELVRATTKIAAGDYATRLDPRTRDELAELVRSFNSMAQALARQREDLEQRRDYMERLLHHATTGVLSLDPAGRLVTLNPAMSRLLQRAGPELRIGAELAGVLERRPELRTLAVAVREARTDSQDVDLELDSEARRYRIVRVELPERSGSGTGRLILLDDVTDMMRSNQLAAWAEMARVIAHEIKNPLTPIQLSTEHLGRLLADRDGPVAPQVEACLQTIHKQVRALHEIAGEFSTYAKLPALALEPLDPAAFLRGVIAPYRSAPPPGIEIREDYRRTPNVSGDPRVLSRAVVNLVQNALQAMPHGGVLEVSVAPDPAHDEVVLAVRDSGSGLDPAARARLFEPYFSTKSGGTGLGLAIALRAVEAHRGRIEVQSEAGVGTRFEIRLPTQPPSSLASSMPTK